MTAGHAIVVLNLPVPDDRRVWAQALALRDAGVPVHVVCPALRGHRPGRRVVDGVHVRYLRTFEGKGVAGVVGEGVWNTLLCLLALPSLARRRVATLQVCNPPDTLFPMLVLARLLGITTVYDQHDLVPAMASARPGFGRLRPLLEVFERLTVRAARVVLTTSLEQQRRLAERFGVDATLVRSATLANAPARHAACEGSAHLGYLGVVGEQEGLEDLLDALALVRSRGVDVSLTIAGDGSYLDDVRRHASAAGLDDIVTFAGWLQGEALERFIGSIDAMVVSDPESEYNHHCAMNKVIEAMARGIPLLMRPLRENLNLAGEHPWVAAGWSVEALADVVADFAEAPAAQRAGVGSALQRRYEETATWAEHRARYLAALGHG